jgi:hypothetical protein
MGGEMLDQRTVRITELAGDSEIIEYQTFEDVAFIGPAVIGP